ncbi:MAG: hypothetical protein ACOVRB_12035 [Akkermansiaceae bacterium]
MNILRIRFWFIRQRWKNRFYRWHLKLRQRTHRNFHASSAAGTRPRVEQLRLPFD